MNSDKENPKIGITLEQISVEDILLGNEPELSGLAILPTRNVVLFPNVTISINLKRQTSLQVAQNGYTDHKPIGVVCQKNPDEDNPTLSRGLYKVGVIADVIKVIELPDGEKSALLRGREPFRILGAADKKRHRNGEKIVAKVEIIEETVPKDDDKSFLTIIKNIKKLVGKILPMYSEGLVHMMNNFVSDGAPVMTVNMLATNLPFEPAEKQKLLELTDVKDRALELLKLLTIKEQEMDMSMDIMNRVRVQLDDEQKRIFLQRQMDLIHEQLYGDEDEISQLQEKAEKVALSEQARQVFNRELNKLDHLNPQNPDYYVVYGYLETLLELPWGKQTEINNDFSVAREALDKDHCGLDKVKERILEQLAVLMHKPDGKAPILCLVGPPGVGKTSLGKSIAEAMGRAYERVSLGGMHDEAEIRGHRRTYIGAMPGRVIDAIKRAKVSNPVLVLDEVDKLGSDYKGDPSSALLEVLDPEQNCHFHDNYIDVDFDLSHVLFLATANTLATIPKPLLDRMEIINITGYIEEEKLEIAKKHLLRRIKDELGIAEDDNFKVSDEAIKEIIENYTSESGVRQLEKSLSSIGRKYILAKMSGKDYPSPVLPEHLKDMLGLSPYRRDKYEGNSFAGVVTGLAWTEAGGEILLAEASLVPGNDKGSAVTGNLGNVMKESVSIAYQWVKSHAKQLNINPELFDKYHLHVHFPEGAVPKDGPSAGITIATAIVSAFLQKKVRSHIAMTGEMTLRGKILPVGGIKEKILAAKRAGITDIVLSAENQRDILDIEPQYIEGIRFHYMDTAIEVIEYAITDETVDNPLAL